MRIPKDVSLAAFIRQLIEAGRAELFYFTDDWLELRAEVMEDYFNECQECLKRGKYTKANCVHHVNEVRHRPDLALSKTYKANDGSPKPNLIPLCKQCHNEVHDKLGEWIKKDRFTNEERW